MRRSQFRAERIADALVRARRILLPAALLLIGLAWPIAQRLEFEQSIERLFAEEDPILEDYKESKSLFGGDALVLVAYDDGELFRPDSLELSEAAEARLRKLAAELDAVPGVLPASTQDYASSGDARPVRLLSLFGFSIERKVSIARDDLFRVSEGLLVGQDRRTAAVFIRLANPGEGPVSRAETIDGIRRVAAEFDRPTYIVGEPVQIHDLFRFVEEDGERFLWWSLLVLAAVLFALFGNPRWVALPLLVVIATIVWTKATLVLAGARLSMVGSMLNSLVTIIGIATATHVAVRFREERRTRDRLDALRETIADLAPAIFWTCGTTAVGFLALLSSGIVPVRSFGLMMGLAAIVVLAAAGSILPGGALAGGIGTDPRGNAADRPLSGALARGARWSRRHSGPLLAGAIAVCAVAAGGFFRLDIETDFSRNFRGDSEIVRGLDFVERRLGGAGTWEVNFSAPAELDDEYLDRTRRLSARLRDLQREFPQLTKIISLTDALDPMPSIPGISRSAADRLNLLAQYQPEVITNLYNPDPDGDPKTSDGRMRIVLRAIERQPAESKEALVEAALRTAREEFPDPKATGPFVLLAELISSLLDDQLASFGIAVSGIGLMMVLAFRSLSVGLISLVPNIVPIVLVVGSMGWLGLPVNIGTAMIACVSMGLTIDFSIHYIAGYRRGRDRGLGVEEALEGTQQQVGRALVFSTAALVAGFSVLTLSHFIPLVHFGVLVSAAMLGGLLGNLVLLPGLLRWVEGRGKTEEGRRKKEGHRSGSRSSSTDPNECQ
ncbi:MAG: MMPL family transporter [Planctomycetales bacterium]